MPTIQNITRPTPRFAFLHLSDGTQVQIHGASADAVSNGLTAYRIGDEFPSRSNPVANSQLVLNHVGPTMFIPGREPEGTPAGYRAPIANYSPPSGPVLMSGQQQFHDAELDEKPYVYNGLFGDAQPAPASPGQYNGPAYNEDFSPMTNFLLQRAHDSGLGNTSPRVVDDPELREPAYTPPTLNFDERRSTHNSEQTSEHRHQTPFFGTQEPAAGLGADPELDGEAYTPPPLFSVGEKRS